MRLLFLTLILSVPAWGQSSGTTGEPMIDPNWNRRIVSLVRDAQIEGQLSQTAEFNECREKNRFDPNQLSGSARQQKVDEAVRCFTDKLNSRSGEALLQLSENLGLQAYDLVPSNNLQDVTKYLTSKLSKAMTGVDPNEENLEKRIQELKFGNRKMVDQRQFVDLYKMQLSKNVLFEISRFCFENLRKASDVDNRNGQSFADYWANFFRDDPGKDFTDNLTDTGNGMFGSNSALVSSDRNTIYSEITKQVGTANPQRLGDFFTMCAGRIHRICQSLNDTTVSDLTITKTKGTNACLVRSRIQAIKTALANVTKIEEAFDGMQGQQLALMLDRPLESFQFGGDKSLDALTNYSSSDMLQGNLGGNSDDCSSNPGTDVCREKYLLGDDSLAKAQHNVDTETRFQEEAEVKRVNEIKSNITDLKQYLLDRGYIDLAEAQDLSAATIEDELRKHYQRKRVALIGGLKDRAGLRQVTQTEVEDMQRDGTLDNRIKANAEAHQSERARLAKLVLFNNILAGHLELQKRDSSGNVQSLGRNIGSLRVEEQALSQNGVNGAFFDNVQQSARPGNSGGSGSGAVDFQSIDVDALIGPVLGRPQQQQQQQGPAGGS